MRIIQVHCKAESRDTKASGRALFAAVDALPQS